MHDELPKKGMGSKVSLELRICGKANRSHQVLAKVLSNTREVFAKVLYNMREVFAKVPYNLRGVFDKVLFNMREMVKTQMQPMTLLMPSNLSKRPRQSMLTRH